MEIPQAIIQNMRFNFLYVDHYVFAKNWIYPESYIPYCMLRYIVKGSAVFRIDGIEYVVKENEVAYIPEGCLMECYSLEDVLSFISIRFSTTTKLNGNDFLSEFYKLTPVTRRPVPELLEYFEEVYRNATSHSISRMIRINANVDLIIASMVELANEQSKDVGDRLEFKNRLMFMDDVHNGEMLDYIRRREKCIGSIKRDPRIQTVVEYLIAHPGESFDSKYLSEMAEMSPSSLRRLFKEHTGKTPGDFIKEIRLMTAARRLLTTDERISIIAYDVGFDDQNYFARIFKETFGVSPGQYRRISRG